MSRLGYTAAVNYIAEAGVYYVGPVMQPSLRNCCVFNLTMLWFPPIIETEYFKCFNIYHEGRIGNFRRPQTFPTRLSEFAIRRPDKPTPQSEHRVGHAATRCLPKSKCAPKSLITTTYVYRYVLCYSVATVKMAIAMSAGYK